MTDENKDAEQAHQEWLQSGEGDRRKEQRRSGVDPRGMIRFEPDKSDRRSGKDRRKDRNNGWDSGTTV